MSSIYLHIPFCKQACHYCDFHFSTSLKHKDAMVQAICKELEMRKEELPNKVENIYFGGGTPSLLNSKDLDSIFNTIYKNFSISEEPEITLEVNPDDIRKRVLEDFKSVGINRISLGVQSFFEEDLRLMNRAHNAKEAKESIELIKTHFDNFSIDLIYGMPAMSNSRWEENISIALNYDIPHLSCYALTVEPKTALERFIEKEVIPPIDDELAASHFDILYHILTSKGFEHYEFSNFGKHGFYSKNNLAYWTGKPYLGIGPSAHSYNGNEKRQWNIKNNVKYIKSISSNSLPNTSEILTKSDQYNEFVMTRLRLKNGINLEELKTRFGQNYFDYFILHIQPHLDEERLEIYKNHAYVTPNAKFLSDGIASDLFNIDFQG